VRCLRKILSEKSKKLVCSQYNGNYITGLPNNQLPITTKCSWNHHNSYIHKIWKTQRIIQNSKKRYFIAKKLIKLVIPRWHHEYQLAYHYHGRILSQNLKVWNPIHVALSIVDIFSWNIKHTILILFSVCTQASAQFAQKKSKCKVSLFCSVVVFYHFWVGPKMPKYMLKWGKTWNNSHFSA